MFSGEYEDANSDHYPSVGQTSSIIEIFVFDVFLYKFKLTV